jgi:hypothetical protein
MGKRKGIQIIKYKFETIDGKITTEIVPDSNIFLILLKKLILWLFRNINYRHFHRDENFVRRKVIQITGIRSCLIEEYWGQRSKSMFQWKIGKYYI